MKFIILLLWVHSIIATNKTSKDDDELVIQRGQIRQTFLHWGPEWSVSFKLTPLSTSELKWWTLGSPSRKAIYWNIMHFTTGREKSRLPAIFLVSSGRVDSASLHVAYNSKGEGTDPVYPYYNLTLDKTYAVEARLEGTKFYLFIDGKEEGTVGPGLDAKEEDNVIFYQSDPWSVSAYSNKMLKPELKADVCKVTDLKIKNNGKDVDIKPQRKSMKKL